MKMAEDRMWTLLEDWNIPVLPSGTASTPEEAVECARKIGYPVVMKISSPDISHKTDVGGIILGLGSDDGVEQAYTDMMDSVARKAPEAAVEGVVIQKVADPGLEVIVGAKLDPQFGHVVMFGLGGIFVEICRDVSLRVAPVDWETARDMILEIKGSQVIRGARGGEPADMDAIINVITAVSMMLGENPYIKELDINPLVVYPGGAVAVDARILAD